VKGRIAARVAWTLWGAVALLLALAGLFTALNASLSEPLSYILLSVDFLAVALIGALVAARRPTNPLGWILLGIMVMMSVVFVGDGYAVYGLYTRPGSLPGTLWAAWASGWLRVFVVGSFLTFVPLLFPTGRLPSPRWRLLGWLTGAFLAGAAFVLALQPRVELDARVGAVRNPIGIEAMADLARWVDGPGAAVSFVFSLAALISLVVRFRQCSGEERQQIKWFGLAIGLMVAYFQTTTLLELAGIPDPGGSVPGIVAAFLAILSIPLAIAIAILKHRLYDIDLIINRTLVYGALTALLALVYVGGVIGIGGVVRALTAQGSNNLAVAASTLIVAALFRPARARIQAFIDRRFYRRKYDASKTLESFSARLRDEVDLDALTAELVAVTGEVMQPSQVSLWLRQGSSGARHHA